MNTKPIIGIAPNYSYEKKEYTLSEDYVLAIEKAGGCPIVLLPHQALPPFLDGLLLTGGGDIDPLLFGEEPLCQSGEINPLRDACEMRICEAALEKNLPMLGICRGMQVMNIVKGGGIYQDIGVQAGTTLKHIQQAPRSYGTHSIFVEDNTLLTDLWENKRTVVNSLHHQSCSTLGEGFIVSARSADGLIEAIEHKDNRFAVGIAYGESIDRAIAVLQDEMQKTADMEAVLEPPTVAGVIGLDDSAVTIKIVAKCKVKMNYAVEAELRRRIKNRFDAEGIEIPFPQQVVHLMKEA